MEEKCLIWLRLEKLKNYTLFVLIWLLACSRKLIRTCLYILTCWFPAVFYFLSKFLTFD